MTTIEPADVLARFALLAGLTDGAQEYGTLCGDAAAEMERVEKENSGPESSGPLAAAAAALAFYWYTLAQAGRGDGSFEADGVKVSPTKPDVVSARRLWSEAIAAAAPWLADTAFLFRRTVL